MSIARANVTEFMRKSYPSHAAHPHMRMLSDRIAGNAPLVRQLSANPVPSRDVYHGVLTSLRAEILVAGSNPKSQGLGSADARAMVQLADELLQVNEFPHWAEIPRVHTVAEEAPVVRNLTINGHPIESIPGLRRDEASGQLSVDKLSAKEVFQFLAGREANFSDLGVLPQGEVGKQLVALRSLIAHGKVWDAQKAYDFLRSAKIRTVNGQVERIEEAKLGSDDLAKVRALLASIEEIKLSLPSLNEIIPAGQEAAYFNGMFSNLESFDQSTLQFLVAINAYPEFRLKAQAYLQNHSVSLSVDNPVLSDLAYLATYDLTKYPATTVSAGQLKYMIVADKGEMGVRAVREAHAKGLVPVVLFSERDDANSLQVRLAKEFGGHTIGLEGDFKATYASFIQIAEKVKAFYQLQFGDNWKSELARSAIYPGYGPLAENAAAIRHFRQNGIAFTGPMEDVVDSAGDKRWFRKVAAEVDSSAVTPGITIDSNDPEEILTQIVEGYREGKFMFPGRLKAANGGGGRGQVIVESLDQLRKAISEVLGQISQNGWADGVMFEQNIPETIHLEVQIMRDRYGNTRNFGMRDCSEQRASQKIQEEAPPSLLKKYPGMQERILKLAMMIAEKVGYVGAGTIELMFKDGKFYFLEMNTRIQVEHPVSEMAFRIRRADGKLENVNLVQLQMMIANGEAIDFSQDDIVQSTVAREFRINAESWRADRKDPRDGKMGIFVPNGGRFDVIEIPTQSQVLDALKQKHPENRAIQSLTSSDLAIRFDSGFEVGDSLINKDPTFGKFLVSVSNEVPQCEEILRLASIAALTLLNISGVEVGPDGKVALDPSSGQTRPFMNNIADHIRLLNTRLLKNHAQGLDKDRHVNAIVDILRNGENLDASVYPALFRASEAESNALNVPVVYAINRVDPDAHYVDTPTTLTDPGAYPGILAAYLNRKKDLRRRLSVTSIFGAKAAKNQRVTGTIDAQGRLMNAVLYRNDLPQTILLSLEMMDEEQILKIDLDYPLNSVIAHVVNLTTGEETAFNVPTDRKNAVKKRISIPGLTGEFEFELDLHNGHNTGAIRNPNGDYVLRVRPYMGNDLTRSFFKLVETLNDKKLSVAAQNNVRADLRQRFVDLAVVYGANTRSREAAIRKIAKSPYNLTTEVARLALHFVSDDRDLQHNVRSMAREILFYRYFESRFHHVSSYQQVVDGDELLDVGSFNDDKHAIVPQRASKRQGVIALAPVMGQQEQAIEETLQKAWAALQAKTVKPDDIIEIWVPQHLASDDEFAQLLQKLVNKTLGQNVLRRVTFMAYSRLGNPAFNPGDGFYTFRPSGDEVGLYEESTKFDPRFPIVPRHEHPMVSEQMERWRWKNFDSVLVRSQHSRVQITEVTGRKVKTDKRYVYDAQIRESLSPTALPAKLIEDYMTARVNGQSTDQILGKVNLMDSLVPADLPERLDSFFLWALFRNGLIDDPVSSDLVDLKKTGVMTAAVIAQMADFLKDKTFFDEPVDEVLGYVAEEMKRLDAQDKASLKQDPAYLPHALNRVRIFMQNPVNLSGDYISFLSVYLSSIFNNVDLDKVTFHYHKQNNGSGYESRVMKIRGIDSLGNYTALHSSDIAATDQVIKSKSELELKVHQLHRKGNMTLQEKLDAVYDPGSPYQELYFEGGILVERPFVAARKEKEIRGFVGLVGGCKTYVICADPLNSNIAFDAPDGDYIKAFIDRTMTERDEEGHIVGAPLIKIEELSAGANLYDAKKKDWSAAIPLDQFGSEFQARYDHARLSGRPNLTTILSLVIGGGIYGPEASHEVIAMEALAVAALTGGNAAGYATGGKPGFEDGKLKAIGGSANFDENVSGSTLVHGKNGVYTQVVTLPKMARLLDTAGSENAEAVLKKIASKLTAKDKIELQKLAYVQTRRTLFFLDDNLAPLLPEGHQPRPVRWKTPPTNIRPVELLQLLAEKDGDGQPLIHFWNARMGQDLLCGWVALPVTQTDGSLKVESVAFMLTNPDGPQQVTMNTEALRKAEEFIEVNSRLGRAMIRYVDFGAGRVSGKDSSFYRLRVLEQFSSYRGAMMKLSGEMMSGASKENYLQIISTQLVKQHQAIAHFNGIESHLIGFGVDYQFVNSGARSGFTINDVFYDLAAAKAFVELLQRSESLARLIDKADKARFRVTPQGQIHFYAIEYAPEQFLRLHSLQTLKVIGGRTMEKSIRILARDVAPVDALRAYKVSALALADEMRLTQIVGEPLSLISEDVILDDIERVSAVAANSAHFVSYDLSERAGLQRISQDEEEDLIALSTLQTRAPDDLRAAISAIRFSPDARFADRPMVDFARYMQDPVFGIVASGDTAAKSRHLMLMNKVFAAIRDGNLEKAKELVPENSILYQSVHAGQVEESQKILEVWFPGQKSIAPSFEPVLADMALKDAGGKALYKIWKSSEASDLLCAWLVVPIRQGDGSLKPEVVSFMMNDITGEKMGAITPDACRKAEEFLEMNSRMGLPMIRLAGSPGFLANDASEREGIEQLGKRAMDKVIAYNGPIYTLEIAEDCGGARIFMGSVTLGGDGHIVTDSLAGRRLAALPAKATAGIKFAKKLAGIPDAAERVAAFEDFAVETLASGTAERAQKVGAVRNIVSPVLMLSHLSSGIAQARVQVKQFNAVQKVLQDRGVIYHLAFEEGKPQLTLGDGTLYSGPIIVQNFINGILSAERLARLLGLVIKVTANGQIKGGQHVYEAEKFIATFVPLARFLAQDRALPTSIQGAAVMADTLVAYAQSAHELLLAYEREFLQTLFGGIAILPVAGASGQYKVELPEGVSWTVNLNDGISFILVSETHTADQAFFSSLVNSLLASMNANLQSEELLNRREVTFVHSEQRLVAERFGNKSKFELRP